MELIRLFWCIFLTPGLVLQPVDSSNTTMGPPIIGSSDPEHFSTIGVDVDLPCDVYAYPNIDTVTWYKVVSEHSVDVVVIDGTKYSGATTSTTAITILNPALNDSGTFYCEVANSYGTASGTVMTLLVTETEGLPIVTMSQHFYTVNAGDNVTIDCSVVSNPILHAVEWILNSSKIVIDNVDFFGGSNSAPSLKIFAIEYYESGNYTCEGTNSYGSALASAWVNVVSSIPTVTLPQTYYTPTEGDNVTLVCNFVSYPSLSAVFWYQDGILIYTDDVSVLGSTPTQPSLTLLEIGYTQSGIYQCFGINALGSANKTLTVNVLAATTTVDETTVAETTVAETSEQQTTVAETTVAETTVAETTEEQTTVAETTVAETTVAETTEEQTTVAETTEEQTTVAETSVAETTIAETTEEQTTVAETTVAETTIAETTEEQTTVAETIVAETTIAETTEQQTTVAETTVAETTVAETTIAETTEEQTTVAETTVAQTTIAETTEQQTTVAETTVAETSVAAETTVAETTIAETTEQQTTVAETTVAETTIAETTEEQTTVAETSVAETTIAETTVAETTEKQTTVAETTVAEATIAETTIAETTEEQTTIAETTVAETTEEQTTVAETSEQQTTVAETTEEQTTVAETTEEQTTVAETTEQQTTEEQTTVAQTTEEPTTVAETTEEQTTVAETTEEPTTVAQTTEEQTTVAETTEEQTTAETTEEQTTVAETTVAQTTEEQTTVAETTEEQTTEQQTTEEQTTVAETTEEQTTVAETTVAQTTEEQTTVAETTEEQTTVAQTTEEQTTVAETTEEQTTVAETTEEQTTAETTEEQTTVAETTVAQTTEEQTTVAQTTEEQTTVAQTTEEQTTVAETTEEQTTVAQTSEEQTTVAETTEEQTVAETTVAETTEEQTTVAQTTVAETTEEQTTVAETSEEQTTVAETTEEQTTVAETSEEQTTVAETTEEQTTVAETTLAETTVAETTEEQTTVAETSVAETTVAETTEAQTTVAQTTVAETTEAEATVAVTTLTTTPPTTTTMTQPTTTTMPATTTSTSVPTTTTKVTTTVNPAVDQRLVGLKNSANSSQTVSDVTSSISSTLNVLNSLDADKNIAVQLEYVASIMESSVRVTISLNGSSEENEKVAEDILKLTDKVSSLSHTCTGTCEKISVSFTSVESSALSMIKRVLDSDQDFNNSLSNVHANGKSETGDHLPATLKTDVGDVTLPEWGTLQKTLAEDKVKLIILAYNDNPYAAEGPSNVHINTGVLTIGMFHENNEEVVYVDNEDPITLSINDDTNLDDLGTPSAQWDNVLELQSEKGSYLTVVTFTPNRSAAMVLLQLPGTGPCVVYGRERGQRPSTREFDFYVKTIGRSRVTKYRPYGLEHNYRNGVLTLSVEGTVDSSPLLLLTQCQVADTTIVVKRDTTQTVPTQRVVGVDLRYFDTVTNTWQKSSGLKITSGSIGRVHFKSNFFGSFSASTLLIPPSPIQFDAVFLNFGERLASTPHVLVTITVVVLLFMLLSLLLRRLDRSDAELWDYLPLIDNKPGAIFMYYFAVSTGLRSVKHMTATVYINMIGEFGESGPRILIDGRRKNFGRGTTSHFVMTSDNYLGPLQSVQIWHDNTGTAPRWLLNKLIVCDGMDNERYVFGCGKWLSMDTEDALTFRTLHMIDESLVDMDAVFVDVSTRYMFDDNLWFSLPKRPSFSKFTRVQRLWLLAAILFLSMVTSAMFFRSSGDDGRSVTIGPIRLNYKQIYVGFLSFVVTILPSLAVVYIFKYRRCRDEMTRYNRNHKENVNCLPWWSIFIAYGLIFLGIISGGFFTMLYSLEWGRDTTVDWMMSFFIGIMESILIMEPCKAAVMAIVMTMLCTGAAQRTMTEIPSSDGMRIAWGDWYLDTSGVIKPKTGDSQEADVGERRRKCHLDKRLNSVILSWLLHFIYILVVAIICSHNHATMAYYQNVALGKRINSSASPKTVADIWNWLETSLVSNMFPFKYYNGDIMTSYVQQSAGPFYRLGLVRLRQTRVKDECEIPNLMRPWMNRCPPEMTSETEDRTPYCINWAKYDPSCFNEIDEDHYSYQYKTASETESLYHMGIVGDYGGGGYVRDLGPTNEVARNTISRLRQQIWIDDKTRALFVDAVVLNSDTMLFSHIKVVFELPSFGGVFMKFHSTTSNLYPYVGSFDYLVLIFQIIFIVIICVRIILVIVSVIKTKCSCLTSLGTWIVILEITLSIAAISVYILRIDRTIEAVERVFNDIGFFVSFEMVELLDILYRMFIGSVCFIAILNLLKPLSFNYYLHLMRTAISIFRVEVINFSIISFLVIIAFSCIIYLMYGYSEPGFKDFKLTFLFLFQIMIGMIHFKEIIKNDDIGLTTLLGLYISIATILTINFFLAGLNFVLTEARSKSTRRGKYQFDEEINKHFWWKMSTVARKVLGQKEIVLNKKELPSYGSADDETADSLMEQVDFMLSSITDRVLVSENEEVRVEVQQLAHINRWYNNQQDIVELDGFRTDTHATTEFVYEDRYGQLVCKLSCLSLDQGDRIFGASMSVITSKWNSIYPCGQATRPCSRVIILTQGMTNGQTGAVSVAVADKSELHYGEKDLPVFMATSFDSGISWHIMTAWRKIVENHSCICCDLASCPTHLVGVACDQWPYLPQRLRGHWESWTIDRCSFTVYSVFHPELSISIGDSSIEDRASIFLILEPTDFLPTIHFLSSETFIKPITVRFSNTVTDTDCLHKVLVLMQDGDLEWKRNCVIAMKPKTSEIKFEVHNIRKGVRRAISVIPADLESSSNSVYGVKCYNGRVNYSSQRLVNELLNYSGRDNVI